MNKTLTQQEEKNSCWSCIFIIIKCLLFLSIWGNITWLIILIKYYKNSDPLIPILCIIISYALYFIFEICSPTLSLILSKITDEEYEKVKSEFIQAAPDINFTCFDEIYNGHKIVSHKFPYKFCMDNSDMPIFYLEPGDKNRKCFIKLIINREILYNDDETHNAFNQKKQEYSQEIESGKRWVDISFFGLKNTYLITFENKCKFLNCLVYIIFIFLTLGELYELILYCNTEKKTITIRKIITIKDEFKILPNENESQNHIENRQDNRSNNETEIILHNNGNELTLKSTINKYIFKSQNENESNRNPENESYRNPENESYRNPENESIIVSKFSN
jgi:hypothetical protein